MSLYLPPRNGATVAVATCDRCHRKRYYDELTSDPNSPALRVCKSPGPGTNSRHATAPDSCVDLYDPYRLAARQPEAINLQFPRPDGVSAETTSSYTWSLIGGTAS